MVNGSVTAPVSILGEAVVSLEVTETEAWLLDVLRQTPFGRVEVEMHGGRIVGADEHKHRKPPAPSGLRA